MSGGVALHAAKSNAQIDAEVAEKGVFYRQRHKKPSDMGGPFMIAVISVSSGAVPICPAQLVAGRAGIGTIWFATNPVAVVSQGLFPPPLGIKTCISTLFQGL